MCLLAPFSSAVPNQNSVSFVSIASSKGEELPFDAMEKAEDIRSSEKTVEESVPSTPNQSEKHVSTELPIAVDDEHINLGWRSWLVVFMTCFAYVPIIGGVLIHET